MIYQCLMVLLHVWATSMMSIPHTHTHTLPSTDLSTASWWSIHKVIVFWGITTYPPRNSRYPFPYRRFWVDDWNHFPFGGTWTGFWGHGQSSDGHQIWGAETETKTWWYCSWRSFKKWSLAMLTRLNSIFFVWRYFSFSIPAFLSLNILPYMSIKTGAHL